MITLVLRFSSRYVGHSQSPILNSILRRLHTVCVAEVYDGARRVGRPNLFTCTNRNLQNLGELPPNFKVMGLSSTVCLPLADGRIQSRRYARQTPFSSRSEQSNSIYRSSKKKPDRFSIQGILSSFTGKDSSSKLDKKEQEKLAQYRDELNRLPEDQQKPYLEGYLQGVLTSKNSTNQMPPPRKSIMPRIYVAIIIAIILAFWTGIVRVRIGEKSIGNLIFSSSDEIRPEDVTVTFDDVRGMDEAKAEVEEIVSYLRNKDKYAKLGGRLPKGVLMVGPPGTGKTLLARAIAGEAQVPFFHTSGSEFDEVLVGQGARRVRDLFERAKARAPCIIFIDEIDSVGSKRVANSIHPFANQTINMLLSEMDGFNQNEGIIVIGATNRLEDLDKALLRPGRFDVRVTVTKPDLDGRKDIFKLYLGRIVHEKLNVDVLAKGTTGFTGADIENMVNQAALKAATEGCNKVYMRHLDESKDRILMGPARTKGRFPDEEVNKNTAYHEAGHTLVAIYTKHATPVHKVTIIPRGSSMGHTALLPDKDQYQVSRAQMQAQLDVMMGGRIAEEMIFGDDNVTTGAADDLKRATELATNMIKQFGLSERLGLRDFTVTDHNSIVNVNELSPQASFSTQELIDQEIARLLKESYDRAKKILVEKAKEHHLLAETLLKYETLSSDEIRQLLKDGKLDRPNLTEPIVVTDFIPRQGEKKRSRHKQPAMIHVNVD
ncbi:ATP-dependent zinc metalloprotease YME1-like protein [Aphelenchoides bicaudatus]|nr:ATP-dependent zinc metalloprotease YME1-like protein [Aphelenchoides bicaudatus]